MLVTASTRVVTVTLPRAFSPAHEHHSSWLSRFCGSIALRLSRLQPERKHRVLRACDSETPFAPHKSKYWYQKVVIRAPAMAAMPRLQQFGPPPPLDESAAELQEVLARDIPWETYMTARLITDKELQLIRRYDKRTEELQASLLDESGPAYVEAFLTVLRNVTKEETVQYILALLLQMLSTNPSRAALFHQIGELHLPGAADPYTIFLRLLQRSDWFTQVSSRARAAYQQRCRWFAGGSLSADAHSSKPLLAHTCRQAANQHSIFSCTYSSSSRCTIAYTGLAAADVAAP